MDTLNAMLDYLHAALPVQASLRKTVGYWQFSPAYQDRQDSSPFVLVIMCSINDIEMQFREKQNGYASNIMTIKLNSCKQLMLASGGMQ